MKALLTALVLSVLGMTAAQAQVSIGIAVPVVCGAYIGDVGFYNPDCGYWNGYGWEGSGVWFSVGHGGYGRGGYGHGGRGHGGWHGGGRHSSHGHR